MHGTGLAYLLNFGHFTPYNTLVNFCLVFVGLVFRVFICLFKYLLSVLYYVYDCCLAW